MYYISKVKSLEGCEKILQGKSTDNLWISSLFSLNILPVKWAWLKKTHTSDGQNTGSLYQQDTIQFGQVMLDPLLRIVSFL